MSTSNDILVGYSPSDFFYSKASDEGTMPSNSQCGNIYNPSNEDWEIKCNKTYFSDNANECYNKELCKNRENVYWIYNNNNMNSGSTQKYLDNNQEYNKQLLTTFNLGVGILLLSTVIIKYTYYNI